MLQQHPCSSSSLSSSLSSSSPLNTHHHQHHHHNHLMMMHHHHHHDDDDDQDNEHAVNSVAAHPLPSILSDLHHIPHPSLYGDGPPLEPPVFHHSIQQQEQQQHDCYPPLQIGPSPPMLEQQQQQHQEPKIEPCTSPSVASSVTSSSAHAPLTSSVATTTTTTDDVNVNELLKEQNLKKQRLARRAELARMSRQRKKARIGELEEQVRDLQHALEQERHLRHQAEMSLVKVSPQAKRELDLDDHCETKHDLDRLVQRWSEASRHTLRQAEELTFQPSLPIQFLEWAMSQEDRFYSDPNGLFQDLFLREMGISQKQYQQILDLKQTLNFQAADLRKIPQRQKALKNALETHATKAIKSVHNFATIVSPEQMGRFTKWVKQHGKVVIKIPLPSSSGSDSDSEARSM